MNNKIRKYQIYGFGGALVDTEVQVSDKFLSGAMIDKGVMTLVDEVRQIELLDLLESGHGNIVRKPGGSVCNSIVAAACLGASTFFSGKVANDCDGDLYVDELRQLGIDFHSAAAEPGVTGKCLVMVTDDAERTMCTFLGISESVSLREISKDALKDSDWFYVEGYLLTDGTRALAVKDAVNFAKKNGVKIAISLSDPFVVNLFGDTLREVIDDGVDLIFGNKAEALAFSNTLDIESAVKILKRYTKTFVITDGANGAITFDGTALNHSKGVEARAIDTNGAGDMFAGAFLFAITEGKNYRAAANFANYCAARVVEQFGPRLNGNVFADIKSRFND